MCFRIKFHAGSSLAYVVMFYGVLSHEAADNFAVKQTSSVFFLTVTNIFPKYL